MASDPGAGQVPSAEQLLAWTDRGEPWPPSVATPAFTDVPAAYATALAMRALRQARGERPRGFKIGFTNPETPWLKHNAPHIRKVFASSALADHGLFNQQQLLESFDRFLIGKERIDSLVYWRILVSQLWIERFGLDGVA